MAHPLLYSTPDTFDFVTSEENCPWLGPVFPYIPGEELFYDLKLVRVPSLEEMIESWGPALGGYGLPAPQVDACGSGLPVEPVTPAPYFSQSEDPDSKPFKPTEICLADPMEYSMPLNFELYGPLDQVSNPVEFTVQCN